MMGISKTISCRLLRGRLLIKLQQRVRLAQCGQNLERVSGHLIRRAGRYPFPSRTVWKIGRHWRLKNST